MYDANRRVGVIDREEHAVDVWPSPVVKHSNRMGRIETFRSDRASVWVTIERKDRLFEAIEPARATMRRLLDDPVRKLLEVGFGVLRDLNAVSHACGAGDRTPAAPA